MPEVSYTVGLSHMEVNANYIMEKAGHFGIEIKPEQADMFKIYCEMIISRNRKYNLTRIVGVDRIIEEHFLDSLAGINVAAGMNAKTLLDIGSGAGLPGIPIKICLPKLKLTIIDSARKKILFLRELLSRLHQDDVILLHKRAEDFGRGEGREAYDWVVTRALAPLVVAAELALPLLKVGGCFWAFKGSTVREELEQSRAIIDYCGGEVDGEIEYRLPQSGKDRIILVIRKVRESEERFPRRSGVPQKKPLR